MSDLNKSRSFSMSLSFAALALINVLVAQNLLGQQVYRYDVIATSSSSRQISDPPSINNNGEVAFNATNTPGGGGVFVDHLPNIPLDLIPGLSNQPSTSISGDIQINDSRQILSLWKFTNTNPVQHFLSVLDGRVVDSWTNVAAANGAGGFNDFNEIYNVGLTINNNGRPVYQTRNGFNSTILTTGIRPSFVSRQFSPSLGPISRPMVSDDDAVVLRRGDTGNDPIFLYQPVQNPGAIPIGIASTFTGFSQIGRSPSISRYSEAVAFYADLNQAGATTLGTNPGPGIFVSITLDNGQRRVIRLAGRLVENNSEPGGNDDDVCDPGEICIPGELGFNLAGDPIFFNSFDTNLRTDVAYIPSGKPGIEDDLVSVSFIATPNIASDVPGRIFTNQTGLWTLTAKITLDAGNVREKPEKANLVAQIGGDINGNTITGISVYDQIANNVDRVAFWASSANGNMIIRAVRDPGIPVIFIPGVGGTELRDPNTNARLWTPESVSSDVSPLAINNSVKATDALRKFKVGLVVVEKEQEVYQSLLNSFRDNGYIEYNLNGDVTRLNETCGGQNLDELRYKHPSLFVFPYDWRKSNGDAGSDGNLTKLKKYIQCVRAIYPDTPVSGTQHGRAFI